MRDDLRLSRAISVVRLSSCGYTVGSIIALASIQVLINAEQESPEAVRTTAFHLSVVAGLVSAVLVGLAVVVLRERDDYQDRRQEHPLRRLGCLGESACAVGRDCHFIENIGSVIALLTLYVRYVVGRPSLAPLIILTYMVPSSLSVPLWIPLSRKVGKIRL